MLAVKISGKFIAYRLCDFYFYFGLIFGLFPIYRLQSNRLAQFVWFLQLMTKYGEKKRKENNRGAGKDRKILGSFVIGFGFFFLPRT